jgi:tetratricopeptide (TPR) repeat protein
MLLSTARLAVCSAVIFGAANFLWAQEKSFAVQAERAFQKAQERAHGESTNLAALIALSRAAFDWAEFARKDAQREEIANTGISAARQVIDRLSTNAAAHYWLGMNLGQLARTKTFGALKLVHEMEEEFLEAQRLDKHIDFAGPDRSLGLLYRDAPGWPTSIGSKRKAREHLEQAVKLHPEFPANQLALLESCEKWADREGFNRQLPAAEKAFAEGKARFTGPEWEQSWADWKKRLTEMKAQSGEVGKHTPPKGGK